MRATLTIASKEIRDHLRDTRSLVSTLSYALIGPAAVLLVSLSRQPAGDRGAAMLWSMASVFALVSAFAGGMNVALDATAGERERRSLVPLLLTAAPRRAIVIGKWLATVAFGVGGMLLTVAGCAAALAIGAGGGATEIVPPGVLIWVLAGLVPLVLLGAACHIVIALKSASAKEAHTWMSSLVFVPMLAGLGLVFAPGVAGEWWPFAPLVGQQMWINRTLADQSVSSGQALAVTLTTVAAGAVALGLARRAFDRDDLLAG